MSSATRGLIPKSTGGRLAMGGALIAAAGVVTESRNRQSSSRTSKIAGKTLMGVGTIGMAAGLELGLERMML